MVTINTGPQKKEMVSFQAIVSSFVQEHYNGRGYYRINMKDDTGELYHAYAWEDDYQGLIIEYPTQVIVTGLHKQSQGEARFQVLSLRHNEAELSYLNGSENRCSEIDTLLQSQHLIAQQKNDLIKLQQLLDSIQQPHLKRFLERVINDKQLMSAFAELPASARHHHNQRGGLLNHSIECAIFVYNATQGSQLTSDERELAVVAGLLHDIGKIKTLTAKNKHSTLGHHLQHEHLTLSVLSHSLMQLERDWPNGSALLMHLLTWEKHRQTFPANPSALLIKTADQFSTAMNIRKQAFKDKPESFYYAHYKTSSGKHYVNRLTANISDRI